MHTSPSPLFNGFLEIDVKPYQNEIEMKERVLEYKYFKTILHKW